MTYRIRIKPDWIKVDTFQAKRDEGRGAWAQPRHSAVRVTHQGYGIFAEASEGRSQFSNRAIAMERLELAIEKFLYPDGGFNAPKIEWTLTPDGREYFDGKVTHKEFYGLCPRQQLARRFEDWSARNRKAMELLNLVPEVKFNANREFGKMGGSRQTLAYMQMFGRGFRTATVAHYQTALDMAKDTFTRHQVTSNITKVGDEWQVSPTIVFRDLIGDMGDIYAAD